MNFIVLIIPAYNPPFELLDFIKNLTSNGFCNIVVINDGSDPNFSDLFEKIKNQKITVLNHTKNEGKGQAIKTGIDFCLKNFKNIFAIITADADGQHCIEDIQNLAKKINPKKPELILGKRFFDKNVPFQRKLGNFLGRKAISFVSKQKIYDTQTGLRALPFSKLRDFEKIPGKKYEYETNMLLYAKKLNLKIKEIPIQTIYINNNKSSHFKTFRDAYVIYKSIFNFFLNEK